MPDTPKFDAARAKKDVSWIASRLKEPSTWAGIAAGLAALGVNLDPGLVKYVTMIGMGLGGVLAFLLPEQSA